MLGEQLPPYIMHQLPSKHTRAQDKRQVLEEVDNRDTNNNPRDDSFKDTIHDISDRLEEQNEKQFEPSQLIPI